MASQPYGAGFFDRAFVLNNRGDRDARLAPNVRAQGNGQRRPPLALAAASASNWMRALLLLLLVRSCAGVACVFDNDGGTGDGQWSTANNWDCSGTPRLPFSNEDATIAEYCSMDVSATVANLVVTTGFILTGIGGDLTVSNAVVVQSGSTINWNSGTLLIHSSFEVQDNADFSLDSDLLLGSGTNGAFLNATDRRVCAYPTFPADRMSPRRC